MTGSVQTVIAAAREFLGERITVNAAVRDQHGRGEDAHTPAPPDAVAFIDTSEEAARLLALCHANRVPAIAFGAGTSLEGHVNAVRGGITLDLSRMTRILEVNSGDLDCRVQAGVTRQQLNEHLRDLGLFFPIDPGSHCTIGGMAATRASGTNAVRYGTMRENVMGLTVALADGRVIRTGGRVRKSSTGYDLTRLFVGSEGTLGVITEIQLRLHGIPEATSAAICQFATLSDAVETVMEIMQCGIPVARIELLDDAQMASCIAYSKLEGLRAAHTLLFEFHGSPAGVAEQAAAARAIAQGWNAESWDWATDPEARARLWRARHDGFWANCAIKPGARIVSTDCVVPISRLAEVILGAREDIEASGMIAPIVGHVGDGNFHTSIIVPDEPDGFSRAMALDRRIVARALDLGGSCSGEHGVGLTKREFLVQEHGAEVMAVMRSLKTALDPHDILNPGKIFLDA